jgi:hypothetical protein
MVGIDLAFDSYTLVVCLDQSNCSLGRGNDSLAHQTVSGTSRPGMR